MADQAPNVTARVAQLCFESDRVAAFLKAVEAMAAGQVDERLPISSRHDELDAIAYGINVLASELGWLGACAREAQEEKAAELQATVASAEARSSAILTAIPDACGYTSSCSMMAFPSCVRRVRRALGAEPRMSCD